jgi:hypothetical protein
MKRPPGSSLLNRSTKKISVMKNLNPILSAFALRVTLLFAAFALVSAATSSAQTTTRAARRTPPIMLPAFVVSEDRLAPPTLNSDGSFTLSDGTVLTPPARNSDGSITLPDGTVLTPPAHEIDATITLPDGTVIDPSDRPAPRHERNTAGT